MNFAKYANYLYGLDVHQLPTPFFVISGRVSKLQPFRCTDQKFIFEESNVICDYIKFYFYMYMANNELVCKLISASTRSRLKKYFDVNTHHVFSLSINNYRNRYLNVCSVYNTNA